MSTFVDGELDNKTVKTDINTVGSDAYLGAKMNKSGVLHEFYNGILDDIRIYDRALSNAEVSELFKIENKPGDDIPPLILSHPKDQILISGQSASLNVAVDDNSTLKYKWKKDGIVLEEGRFKGTATANLDIDEITENDSGNYSVVIFNETESIESNA